MQRVASAGRIVGNSNALNFKRYLDDFPYKVISNWWDSLGGASKPIYVVQTNEEIVKRCVLMTTDPGDLVLDQTCGSGTTAAVSERWGRRWITIDTSRVALALTRTRLASSIFESYVLRDTREGQVKEAEVSGQADVSDLSTGDIRQGFVYRRSARVDSSAFANNAEIDVIDTKWHSILHDARTSFNQVLSTAFEPWEMPNELRDDAPREAAANMENFWIALARRQSEIEISTKKSSDIEYFYDRPYTRAKTQ